MRHSKKLAALALVAGIAVTGSAAFAYWSTNGGGTGSASTEAGATNAIQVNQVDSLDAMYPGDSAQDLKFNLQNTNSHQTLHVAGVSVAVTDVTRGVDSVTGNPISVFSFCGAANFDIVQPSAATVAREVAGGDTSDDITSGSIKFHDDPAHSQDACKDAAVVLTYTAS